MAAMILHSLTSAYSTIPQNSEWSCLVDKFGLIAAVSVWYIIAFGCIAYIFHKFEYRIPGNSCEKGMRYGAAVSILWLWGMLEGVSLSGNSIIDELITGICDAVPIFLMGLLLGKFTTKRNYSYCTKKLVNDSIEFFPFLIFSIIFLSERYYLYMSGIIDSGYKTNPYFTFIWTLVMGICICTSYVLLRDAVQDTTPFLNSMKFGIIIFGVNWLSFMIFIPFVFGNTFTDFIIRVISDSVSVTLSFYLSEAIRNRMYEKFYKKLKL